MSNTSPEGEGYTLNEKGGIDLVQEAEDDLAKLPANQDEVDNKTPRIDARTEEPENQDLSLL